MSYMRYKTLVEKNPDIGREEVKKKLKCGDLQAAAFASRLTAEKDGHKRAAKLSAPPEPKFIPPKHKRGKR